MRRDRVKRAAGSSRRQPCPLQRADIEDTTALPHHRPVCHPGVVKRGGNQYLGSAVMP